MDVYNSRKPLVKAGWRRALLYVLALGISGGILLVGFSLTAYQNKPGGSQGLFYLMKESFPPMMVLSVFVLTLIITYVFCRWIDRRSFLSLGLEMRGRVPEAIAGAALGVFVVAGTCLIIQLAGHLKWMDILFDPKSLFLALGTILLSASYEEIIFRGYLLDNLMASFPKWTALIISSLLFMAFHWSASGLFPLLNALALGFITGLFYLYTRNLWFPLFFHAAWKFMTGPIFGFSNDSSSQSLLQATVQGNENVTGGTQGLEGSLVLTAVSLLSAAALYLILQQKNQSKISTSSRSNIRSFPAKG